MTDLKVHLVPLLYNILGFSDEYIERSGHHYRNLNPRRFIKYNA